MHKRVFRFFIILQGLQEHIVIEYLYKLYLYEQSNFSFYHKRIRFNLFLYIALYLWKNIFLWNESSFKSKFHFYYSNFAV